MNTDCQLQIEMAHYMREYNKQSEVLQSFFYKTGHETQQQIEDGKSEADIRESWKPV
jgi:hypothetical protein